MSDNSSLSPLIYFQIALNTSLYPSILPRQSHNTTSHTYTPHNNTPHNNTHFNLTTNFCLTHNNTTHAFSPNFSTPLSTLFSTPFNHLPTFIESIIFLTIIISAIVGNMLVILSVLRFRRLRTKANVFIVSLAFADLVVAILVMPFNAIQELADR